MGLVTPRCRSVRFLSIVLATAVLAACTSSSGAKPKGGSVPENTETAIAYLTQARQMVAQLAQAVVPGATLRQTGSDGPPRDCAAPLKGLTYFSIFRDFDAPSGKTGASLLASITAQLKEMGFITAASDTQAAFVVVNAEKDKKVGVAAMASPTTSLIRIGVSTQCGRPTSADDDVGIDPSASAS